VLRYGFRTISGRTGGWSVEAPATLARSAATVTLRERIASTNGAEMNRDDEQQQRLSIYQAREIHEASRT
jgi:hypothetical protein